MRRLILIAAFALLPSHVSAQTTSQICGSCLAASACGTSEIAPNSVNGSKIAIGSDATGDLMYYNGTDYARLGIGAADQVLTVSGGLPAWAAAAGGGGGNGWASNKGFWWFNCGAGNTATQCDAVGMPAMTNAGATLGNGSDTTSNKVSYTSNAATSGTVTSQRMNKYIRPDQEPTVTYVFETGASITNIRIWVGMQAETSLANSDAPTSSSICMVRYSTVVPDTNWTLVTCGAVACTATSMGVAPAVDTHYTIIVTYNQNGGSADDCTATINGANSTTNTANLPAATTSMMGMIGHITQENATKVINIASGAFETDWTL